MKIKKYNRTQRTKKEKLNKVENQKINNPWH